MIPSFLGQQSRGDIFFILKSMRARELDQEVRLLSSRRFIDSLSFENSPDENLRKVFSRNLLVVDLFYHDIQDRKKSYEDDLVKQITLIYLLAFITVNCAGIAYVMRTPNFVCYASLTVSSLLFGVSLFNHLCDFRKQRLEKELFSKYQTHFFSLTYASALTDACPICLDQLNPDMEVTGHLANGRIPHFFHKSCIEKMIESTGTHQKHFFDCPCCRNSVIFGKVLLA